MTPELSLLSSLVIFDLSFEACPLGAVGPVARGGQDQLIALFYGRKNSIAQAQETVW